MLISLLKEATRDMRFKFVSIWHPMQKRFARMILLYDFHLEMSKAKPWVNAYKMAMP